ncbi:MAG: tetratricopeptide repeat protein [Rhodopirellula sp.]|nr:tetratricopeptide repeat protein [Rhodopirellula sp.]
MKIARVLAEADPSDAQKQRDLAVSFERLGQVSLAVGKTDDALKYFSDELVIAERRMKADPSDVDAKRFTSVVYNFLGDVFLKLGRTDDALTQFQDGLTIRRVLAEADPSSAEKQRDLMFSHNKLGEVEVQAGRYETAKGHFESGIEVLDRMIANGQNVAACQQEKAFLERRRQFCGSALIATGDWDVLLQQPAEILPVLLTTRCTFLTQQKRTADVVQAAAKLRELAASAQDGSANEQKGGMLYNAACGYGLCAKLAAGWDGKSPASGDQNPEAVKLSVEQRAERERFTALALTALKAAIEVGFDNFDHMQQDADLAALHDLPEFKALLPKSE